MTVFALFKSPKLAFSLATDTRTKPLTPPLGRLFVYLSRSILSIYLSRSNALSLAGQRDEEEEDWSRRQPVSGRLETREESGAVESFFLVLDGESPFLPATCPSSVRPESWAWEKVEGGEDLSRRKKKKTLKATSLPAPWLLLSAKLMKRLREASVQTRLGGIHHCSVKTHGLLHTSLALPLFRSLGVSTCTQTPPISFGRERRSDEVA